MKLVIIVSNTECRGIETKEDKMRKGDRLLNFIDSLWLFSLISFIENKVHSLSSTKLFFWSLANVRGGSLEELRVVLFKDLRFGQFIFYIQIQLQSL